MRVESVMTREVVAVGPATPLRELARLLADRRISGVPVVEGGVVVGVVSGTDLVRRAAGKGNGAAPTAGGVMSAPAVSIGAGHRIAEAAALMTRRHVDRLPVLGEGGALVGIVTRADLVRAFARPDSEIAAELAAELGGVDVEVAGGDVTLRGVVSSRRAAGALAARAAAVAGVVAVVDRLIVVNDAPRERRAGPLRRAASAPRRRRRSG